MDTQVENKEGIDSDGADAAAKEYDETYCYVCQIAFTSLQHAKQHLSGQKHTKKMRQYGSQARMTTPLDNTSWYHCNVCNVDCNSQYHLEQHQVGSAHKKKVRSMGMMSVRNIAAVPATPDFMVQETTLETPEKLLRPDVENVQESVCADGVSILTAETRVEVPGQETPVTTDILDEKLHFNQCSTPVNICREETSCALERDDETKLKQQDQNDVTATIIKEVDSMSERDNACTKVTQLVQNILPATGRNGNENENITCKKEEDETKEKQLFQNDEKPTVGSENTTPTVQLPPSVDDDLCAKFLQLTLKSQDAEDGCDDSYVDADGNRQAVYSIDSEGRGQCFICNVGLDSRIKSSQHFRGKNHAKQLSRAKNGYLQLTFVPGLYSCSECQVNFSGPESHAQHLQSEKHKAKLAQSQCVPERSLPLHVKEVVDCDMDPYSLMTTTLPRSYQIDLYEAAMKGDVVVFLPTGTGKTVISAMVVSHMLQLNPARPVVFLVDRVLLVMQQSKVLKTELGDKMYTRIDDGVQHDRQLKIGTLCGEKQDTGGELIWKQDIVVTTAAYYLNLLEKQVVCWQDLCLAVFDEAHHCVKSHPFNRLLEQFHRKLQLKHRPKILGLTASPAGRETVEDTEKMLKRLLENIGDGKLAAIMENDRSFKELSKYKTQTKLIAKELGLTVNEKELQDELQKYLFLCYNRLSVETDFGNFDSREEVKTCQDLKGDVLEAFQIFLQDAKPIEPDRNIYIEALKLHCSVLCEALSAVGDGSVEFAFRVLQDLLNRSHPGSFEKAAELNLAHQKVKSLTEHFALRTEEEKEDDKMAVKTVAREILQGIDWDSREQGKQPFVLVLVKTRVVAQQMTEALKEMEELKECGICPVCIVGHGGGSSDGGGMTIKKQSRALEGIRNYEYQVVVATSVAEEGVDFPECELVIHMNPPSSVTALVQTRGRARKQGVSRFIALCREPGQKDKIELLQKKEENMYKAAKKIIDTY
ncbi:uncharacterized protein LOC106154762 [Lingula anatina]|uniref:Uncharacterized protein LOC106154762 n=1 Tax=Lingula anatina TaxID=7574 RepID=A0A1S3HGS0_LINAN|nr:uncharacterized protein LOC106154762 [Lingula anatina]|eukprot:XP_013384681.1 uncharacterized protein LOC106154762 [Lingula anatina]